MDKNIYDTPKSDLGEKSAIDIPDEIAKKIKNGWIAATISGLFTFGITILAVNFGTMSSLFDIWTSIDVVLIFLLAFGIYKKSRVAASIMFVYFLLSKIWLITETGKFNGIILSVVFLYFYFQAMIGTFQYHKLINTKTSEEPRNTNEE